MRRFLIILFSQTVLILLLGCQLGIEEYNTFEKDFLFDPFDTLNEEIWQKVNNTVIEFSELRSENVYTSNGNLVIKITKTPQTGGGIVSKKFFRNGSFSILSLNPNTNIVLELEINIPQTYSKASIRYYFSHTLSKIIVETEILSPYETFLKKFDNTLTNINDPTILTITTFPDRVEMNVNDQKLITYSLRDPIKIVEVRINAYTKVIDLDLSEKNVLVDYFRYQRN